MLISTRTGWIKGYALCLHMVLLMVCCHTVISQTPKKNPKITAAGANTTFNCSVSHVDETDWLFQGINIAHGREAHAPEHHNIEIRDNDTESVLTVNSVGEDDEGIYLCQERGKTTMEFNLIVEIPPVVYLETSENGTIIDNLDVAFKEETLIRCVANGSKPTVSLSWEVNGQEEIGTFTIDNSREDERVIVSTLQYIPNRGDRTLACITGGQQAIPSVMVKAEVNVMYEPICTLFVTNETTNEYRLLCSCDANPPPSNYSIYENGTLYSTGSAAVISSDQTARVYCSAYNAIGGDTTDERVLTPFIVPQPLPNSRVALILLVCVAVPAISVIVIVLLCRRKKQREQTEREQNIMRQTNRLMTVTLAGLPLPQGENAGEDIPLREVEQDLADPETTEEWTRLHGDNDEDV